MGVVAEILQGARNATEFIAAVREWNVDVQLAASNVLNRLCERGQRFDPIAHDEEGCNRKQHHHGQADSNQRVLQRRQLGKIYSHRNADEKNANILAGCVLHGKVAGHEIATEQGSRSEIGFASRQKGLGRMTRSQRCADGALPILGEHIGRDAQIVAAFHSEDGRDATNGLRGAIDEIVIAQLGHRLRRNGSQVFSIDADVYSSYGRLRHDRHGARGIDGVLHRHEVDRLAHVVCHRCNHDADAQQHQNQCQRNALHYDG